MGEQSTVVVQVLTDDDVRRAIGSALETIEARMPGEDLAVVLADAVEYRLDDAQVIDAAHELAQNVWLVTGKQAPHCRRCDVTGDGFAEFGQVARSLLESTDTPGAAGA